MFCTKRHLVKYKFLLLKYRNFDDFDVESLNSNFFFFQNRSEKTYLSYKTDDNAIGQRSRIWLREVQEDGITFANENEAATLIMSADFQEDKLVVEGGSLLYRHGYYYLFFSADGYLSPTYHINVARSKTVPISQLKLYFHNFFLCSWKAIFRKDSLIFSTPITRDTTLA